MSSGAHRAGNPASTGEVCTIDLRDPDGRLIRKITEREADLILKNGLGLRRGKHEVRLADPAVRSRGAGPSVTTLGHRQERKEHHPRCGKWRKSA